MDGWHLLISAAIGGTGGVAFLKFVADSVFRSKQNLRQLELIERRAQTRGNARVHEPAAERAA